MTATIAPTGVAATVLSAAAHRTGAALTAPGAPDVSYLELAAAAREIAGGLERLGIQPGDRVAILAGTRPVWTLADLGILWAGATVVPIYHTSSPSECEYILRHAAVRAIFCEDEAQLAKLDRAALPDLAHAIVMTGHTPDAITLAELRAGGDRPLPAPAKPEDIATIIYTSGTTGPPKGCVVTHASLLATVAMYERELGLGDGPLIVYLFLPLAHSLARVAQLAVLHSGGTLAFWGGDPKRIVAELAEIRPTHFPSVPRIYEKIHTAVLSEAAAQRRLKRGVFRWALREGARFSAATRAGASPGRLRRLRHGVADRLVLARVRSVFGDRLVFAMCGAAPIGAEILEFFDACGVLVLEGYGLTESCAAASVNTPHGLRFGSVGRPLPGTEVAIASDGEILIAGPHVFSGYHRDPDATSDALDGRWLRSGDLGELDADGYLHITGRKKDLIITSSGKNISPENLESALRETRWISQALVAGDRRPYLVALVTLDPDEAPKLAAELGIAPDVAAMARDPRVHAAVAGGVETVNAQFARIEQIKRFAILERDFTQEAGELTPTLKVKRSVVHEHFGDRIEALYGD
jgi:long-chain acyl-CoA synthetase